jgi:hypothetical protein
LGAKPREEISDRGSADYPQAETSSELEGMEVSVGVVALEVSKDFDRLQSRINSQ